MDRVSYWAASYLTPLAPIKKAFSEVALEAIKTVAGCYLPTYQRFLWRAILLTLGVNLLLNKRRQEEAPKDQKKNAIKDQQSLTPASGGVANNQPQNPPIPEKVVIVRNTNLGEALEASPIKLLIDDAFALLVSWGITDLSMVASLKGVCRSFYHKRELINRSVRALHYPSTVRKIESSQLHQIATTFTDICVLDMHRSADLMNGGSLDFANMIQRLSHLQKLSVDGPFVNDETLLALSLSCTKLQTLELSQTKIFGDHFSQEKKPLKPDAKFFPGFASLETLEFHDCRLLANAGLKTIVSSCGRLSSFVLINNSSSCALTGEGIGQALVGCTTLKKVQVMGYVGVPLISLWHSCLETVCITHPLLLEHETLKSQSRLTSLTLWGNSVKEFALSALSLSCTRLQELELSGAEITGEMLQEDRSSFVLEEDKKTSHGTTPLLESKRGESRFAFLQTLVLENCSLLTNLGLKAILSHSPFLSSFILRKNNTFPNSFLSGEGIGQALVRCTTLKKVRVMGHPGVPLVCIWQPCLKEVGLEAPLLLSKERLDSHNSLTSLTLIHGTSRLFEQLLPQCRNLQELIIHNPASIEWLSAISSALEETNGLESLSLKFSKAATHYTFNTQELETILDKSPHLKSLEILNYKGALLTMKDSGPTHFIGKPKALEKLSLGRKMECSSQSIANLINHSLNLYDLSLENIAIDDEALLNALKHHTSLQNIIIFGEVGKRSHEQAAQLHAALKEKFPKIHFLATP